MELKWWIKSDWKQEAVFLYFRHYCHVQKLQKITLSSAFQFISEWMSKQENWMKFECIQRFAVFSNLSFLMSSSLEWVSKVNDGLFPRCSFVLAAVSPAVVVPAMLLLQKDGYGVEQGIPTLLMAAGSFDDILAITGFTTCLGMAFATGNLFVQSHIIQCYVFWNTTPAYL